jgi:5-methylcytosine-specific restriction protein B
VSDYSGTEQILLGDRDPLVRRVARSLLEHGLGQGVSMFDPPRRTWSPEVVSELYQRYNEKPDMGKDTFLVKLERQLHGASDDVILLVAELLTLHALPLHNFGQTAKLARINQVLSWMKTPIELPGDVAAAFTQTSWSGGAGVHTMLWKWLQDAVVLVRSWLDLQESERVAALGDPWKWLAVIREFPGMPSLREALLYLAFPGYFLPAINLKHKRAIRDAFAYRLDRRTGDLDRDLYEITLAIQRDFGGPVWYWRDPFAREWQPGPDPEAKRAWLVRPRSGGRTLADNWQRDGFVSLAASHLGLNDLEADLPAVRQAVDAGYHHLDYARRAALALEYHAFLSQMAEGHIVATLDGDYLYVGVITGPPAYDPAASESELRRSATWQDANPITAALASEELSSALDQQGAVVDVTSAYGYLSRLVGATEEPPPAGSGDTGGTVSVPGLAPATLELAGKLHMPQPWLQDVIDILQSRQQAVFYGPPGTGKTYLAQALADHVAGPGAGATSLVQFHPSYAYEDFFEGYRPAGEDEKAAFKLTSGPLRLLATAAARDPEHPYILIIDEINRANLPKVFGELYFLLEYRKKRIRLQYSPEELFSLPPNVFFIGTMNTADRSIALVDAAIRRRFAFIELHPDEPPIRDLLATWLQDQNHPAAERPELLAALNACIGDGDRDIKIGPSYLMRPEAATDAGLERIWRYDLLPLLEEHYYGRLSRSEIVRRFGLEAIRARIAAQS